MAKKKTQKEEQAIKPLIKAELKDLSLEELQKLYAEVEVQRAQKTLSAEEYDILENSVVLLRKMERNRISAIQKELYGKAQDYSLEVKELAKSIRERITKMDKPSKVLQKIDSALKSILHIALKFE